MNFSLTFAGAIYQELRGKTSRSHHFNPRIKSKQNPYPGATHGNHSGFRRNLEGVSISRLGRKRKTRGRSHF